MPEYENMTFDEVVALKRAKEAELAALREDLKALARAEERHVRFEELKRRLGGNITQEDLELLGKVLDEPSGQTAGVAGVPSDAAVGTPGE